MFQSQQKKLLEILQFDTSNLKQYQLRNSRCMSEKNVIKIVLHINIYYYISRSAFRTLLLNTEKDTLTFNALGKEFPVIIQLWRAHYTVLDLFTRKILIW